MNNEIVLSLDLTGVQQVVKELQNIVKNLTRMFPKVSLKTNKKYSNSFEESLEKENINSDGLKACYLYFNSLRRHKGYEGFERINFKDNPSSEHLQLRGVDLIIYKRDKYGNKLSKFIELKLCNEKHTHFFFEYERVSGRSGWAISEDAITDVIFYTVGKTLYVIGYKELRNYLKSNLAELVNKYHWQSIEYKTTKNNKRTQTRGNKLIKIPIQTAIKTFVNENGKPFIIEFEDEYLQMFNNDF